MALDAAKDIALGSKLAAPPRGNRRAAIGHAKRVCPNSWLARYAIAALGAGHPSLDEFLYYRAYDASFPECELRRLVGKRMQKRFHTVCNDGRWFAAAHDKQLFYQICAGAGLPVPVTVATYAARQRTGLGRNLTSREALRDFLKQRDTIPLFLKPIEGIFSIGVLHVLHCDGDSIALKGHGTVPAEQLFDYMDAIAPAGYLLQDVLLPSPFAAWNFGSTVGSLRVLVFYGSGEPHIESAVIKIPARESVADNFWREGNLIAGVDADRGNLGPALRGTGETLFALELHPATAIPFRKMTVPGWDAVRALVVDAARLFPGVRTQSWDLALTAAGPVLLEMNFGGDLNLHQLAHRRGALSDGYAAHLRACGFKARLL